MANEAATAALLRWQAAEEEHTLFDGADVSPEALSQNADTVSSAITGDHGGLNLRGRDLSGASLRAADLSRVDLRDANLEGARASGTRLYAAQLESAQMTGADLVGADLSSSSAGEANFEEAMLEDARMVSSQLRFASFTDATLEGADLTETDLWGARFDRAVADHATFRKARMDESSLCETQLNGADLSLVTLRRAKMHRAELRNADLRGAILDGADLTGANLSGASLPNLSLIGCNLTGTFFAGAWLERTRMRAVQLGGMVGEEKAGNFAASLDSYVVLERNFISLGISDDASWAYLRKRRVGKRLHLQLCRDHAKHSRWGAATKEGALLVSDSAAEWLCDYGESLARVARAFLCILVFFAAMYWLTGSLKAREGFSTSHVWAPVNYLLFSLDSMTTVGTSEVALKPKGELGILLSSLQTVLGTILLGLFGFVLGARIRN